MTFQLVIAASVAMYNLEYSRYHRQITGRDPEPGSVVFALDPSVSRSGRDAYAIVSEGSGARIIGNCERSIWYGLYDLLERRGGCHWYWDVDVVPTKDAIDLSGLDVHEEARFEYRGIRYFAHRGLTRFQAEHWGPKEWKRELDWCLKRRINVIMLRIGQDDLFQRAFPDTVPYPDPSRPLPGAGAGYDNRSLFWSLQYRGDLRRRIQKYAFDRGLMVPEDYGTMTHWYSRTPEEFLEKRRPSFLPQSTVGYSQRNGLVWDVRDDKWADAYWHLTKTAVDEYGQGVSTRLLHTPGLGERRCFTNRQENLKLKIDVLNKFLARAHREFPAAKNLIAGWDFYFTWHPDEVRELVSHLDPRRDIIWDYEGDATRDYRPEMKDIGGNNFTKWGLVGKFPYTFSIFLCYENALDIRANYPLIEERQRIVQDDSACVGYVFWPESSHTDTLLLDYFTANAWAKSAKPHAMVLDEFCKNRYGSHARTMKRLWEFAVSVSYMSDWGGNYGYLFTRPSFARRQYGPAMNSGAIQWGDRLAVSGRAFGELAKVEWREEAIRRDTIDIARTILDRIIVHEACSLAEDYRKWQQSLRDGSDIPDRADRLARLADRMADLLELHTDYSLWESFVRMNDVEPVRNADFPSVLFDNASNDYCQSHQYELARYWYAPRARQWADRMSELVQANDRDGELRLEDGEKMRAELQTLPLESLRPRAERTGKSYADVMKSIAALIDLHHERITKGEDKR